jgi:hypothetical protein
MAMFKILFMKDSNVIKPTNKIDANLVNYVHNYIREAIKEFKNSNYTIEEIGKGKRENGESQLYGPFLIEKLYNFIDKTITEKEAKDAYETIKKVISRIKELNLLKSNKLKKSKTYQDNENEEMKDAMPSILEREWKMDIEEGVVKEMSEEGSSSYNTDEESEIGEDGDFVSAEELTERKERIENASQTIKNIENSKNYTGVRLDIYLNTINITKQNIKNMTNNEFNNFMSSVEDFCIKYYEDLENKEKEKEKKIRHSSYKKPTPKNSLPSKKVKTKKNSTSPIIEEVSNESNSQEYEAKQNGAKKREDRVSDLQDAIDLQNHSRLFKISINEFATLLDNEIIYNNFKSMSDKEFNDKMTKIELLKNNLLNSSGIYVDKIWELCDILIDIKKNNLNELDKKAKKGIKESIGDIKVELLDIVGDLHKNEERIQSRINIIEGRVFELISDIEKHHNFARDVNFVSILAQSLMNYAGPNPQIFNSKISTKSDNQNKKREI